MIWYIVWLRPFKLLYLITKDMENIIQIRVPYILIVRDDRLRDYVWVDERVINEWIVDSYDMKTIDINKDNIRLVDYIKETYLSFLREENND